MYSSRPRTPNLGLSTAPDQHLQLLKGCCHEAERAEIVGIQLQGLRNHLPESLHPHLTGLIEEIHRTSALLRDLADKSQVHFSQVTAVFDYLNIILPCLRLSLQDITSYYDNNHMSKDRRWRKMYHHMGVELPGLTLPARFIMYNRLLEQLLYLLISGEKRSPNFDFTTVESLRLRILELRKARLIPPPPPVRTDLIRQASAPDFWREGTNSHWAEAIFSQPLPTRREFQKKKSSEVFGPCQQLGHISSYRDVKTLVKRSFDNDRVSVIFFQRIKEKAPYILARERHAEEAWVAMMGVHELRIKRKSNSALCLSRWDRDERKPKPWASLSFVTWEEMVLFFCTFLSLKARSMRTIQVNQDEYELSRETKLYQAQIRDDGGYHGLMIMEDEFTGGLRLQAVVWDGPLRLCPVWTAFIPSDISPRWAHRKSRYCVQLRRLQLFTFCDGYEGRRQRRGNESVLFEIEFVHSEAAMRFKELMSNPDSVRSISSRGSAGAALADGY